jgi:uncharacterized membrane protein
MGHTSGVSLFRVIAGQWRELLALFLSFPVIGVYWLQHHNAGRIYVRSDYAAGGLNLCFLFAVTFLPDPLRIWCFHVGTVHERAASVVLTIGLSLPPLLWLVKWVYGMRRRRLMDERLAPDFVSQMTRRYAVSSGLHATAIPLAFLVPRLAVSLALGVIAPFLLPQPKPRYKAGLEPQEREILAQ